MDLLRPYIHATDITSTIAASKQNQNTNKNVIFLFLFYIYTLLIIIYMYVNDGIYDYAPTSQSGYAQSGRYKGRANWHAPPPKKKKWATAETNTSKKSFRKIKFKKGAKKISPVIRIYGDGLILSDDAWNQHLYIYIYIYIYSFCLCFFTCFEKKIHFCVFDIWLYSKEMVYLSFPISVLI